ncbi:MAG: hypothetical protein OEQ12_04765 [Nitrosopumilus sp.]|nr:hypothetical protein [Nitrosopumilus sp.]
MMTTNGEKIRDYLENVSYELSLGCTYNGHRYSQIGTISCIICGKTKRDYNTKSSNPYKIQILPKK